MKVQHKRQEPQNQEYQQQEYPTQDYTGSASYPIQTYSEYPTQQYQQGYESQGNSESANESSRTATPVLPPQITSASKADDAKPTAKEIPNEES